MAELVLDAKTEGFFEQPAVVAGRAADVLMVADMVPVPANGCAVVDEGSAVGVEEAFC